MSKGSERRERQVTNKEYSDSWDRIFGDKDEKEEKAKK